MIPVPNTPGSRHPSKVGWCRCGYASRTNKLEQIGASVAAMTAAPTMTEAAAMAKAATVSITTAVKSEADPNRTIEGRPIAGIAIIGIVIAPAPPDSAHYMPNFGRAPRSCKLAHFARLGRRVPRDRAWLEARPALTRAALRKLPAYYTALRNRRCYGWAAHRSRTRRAPLRVRKVPKASESAVTCESLHRLGLDHDSRQGCKAHAPPQTLLRIQALAGTTD